MKTGIDWLRSCSTMRDGFALISESDIDNYDEAWQARVDAAEKLAEEWAKSLASARAEGIAEGEARGRVKGLRDVLKGMAPFRVHYIGEAVAQFIETAIARADKAIDAAPPAKEQTTEIGGRIYPCARCGILRSASEGGRIFTVCDDCSNKPPAKEPDGK